MKTILKAWGFLWKIIALPFGYITVVCALIGYGPKECGNWAKHCGLPWFW